MGFLWEKIIKKINLNIYILCICLWSNDYLFIGCENKKVIILNLKKGTITKEIIEDGFVKTIRTTEHPNYGKCIIYECQHYLKILANINNNLDK